MLGGLVAVLGRHLVEVVKLKAYAAALYAAAGLFLLFALGFALVAVRNWLAVAFHVVYPDLWVALGLVVVMAILIGLAMYFQRKQPPTKPAADIAWLAGPPAAKFAVRRLSPRTVAVGIVLIAGLVIGRRMTHRSST